MRIILVAAIGAALIAGVWWVIRTRDLYAQLAGIIPERTIAPLTSLEVRYSACPIAATDSLVPGVTCPQRELMSGEAAEEIAAEALQWIEDGRNKEGRNGLDEEARDERGRDVEALVVLGLIQLYGTDRRAPRPAEAIATFDSALQLTTDPAGVMVNLAAAYLALAEQSQSVSDLDQSLEWSNWAVELQPGLPQARFNRAMALEALMADSAAKREWRAYLALTQPSGFVARIRAWLGDGLRREAEQRLRALENMAPSPVPEVNAGERAWTEFAQENPQRARQQAWDGMLTAWAEAVEAGDTALAATHLRRAEVVGQALVRRTNGDAMVADHVREIRARMENGRALADAAHAQRIVAEASQAIRDLENARADSLLAGLHPSSLTVPLRMWTSLQRASVLINLTEWDRAGAALAAATENVDTLRYPVATAYALWLRGTIQGRRGGYEEAVAIWKSAEVLYGRLGEPASRARVQGYIAEALTDIGQVDAAGEWYQRSVRTARSFGASVTRHNVLRSAAISAELMGLHRAMRDLANEDVAVAEEYGDPAFIAEARLNRAALLAASGQKALALRDLATTPLDSITQPHVREFVTMVTAYVRATAQLDTHPDSVAATVEPLIRYEGSEFWRVRGLSLRARAAVLRGDTAGARADLESVFTARKTFHAPAGGALRRPSADAAIALDHLVKVLAERGDTTGSLQLLERGAGAMAPIRVGETTLPREMPDDRVVIRPFLVDSTLVVWTVARGRVEMSQTPVNPDSLRSAIRVVGFPLMLNGPAEKELKYLYRLLVGPAERRLRAGRDEIVFVDDPRLGSIPYAALLNGARVPVVENHPVWSAVSVAAAAQPAASVPPQSVAVLAPEFNTELNPVLDPLPAAKAEGDSVSLFYGPRVIQVAGTPAGFLDALRSAEVVHFAGHAVTDPLRPERSYLVLSPGLKNAAGHLRASALDSVQADRVRLVVLSACTTLGSGAASNGLTGLSGALLDRGAGGVIGSLWRVDDDSTRALMVAFHKHYARSPNPQRALWQAQREMYERGSRPASWAGFRYMGR